MTETQKVRSYSSWEEEASDQLSEWFWGNLTFHGFRCLKVFLIISTPVFLGGVAVAPSGVNRVDHGIEMVGKQHAFLWAALGVGVKGTAQGVGSVLGPYLENKQEGN